MASLKSRRINPDKFHKSQLKFYAILIPVSAFMVLPILFIIFHAFKPIDELFAYPPRFFTTRPTLDNFKRLFTATTESNVPVSRYLFNSVVSTLFTVLFTLWVTASAGYVLSKKNFKGKDTLFTINTLALMFVPVAVSIPRFLVIVKLGLIDNFFAHILPLLGYACWAFFS